MRSGLRDDVRLLRHRALFKWLARLSFDVGATSGDRWVESENTVHLQWLRMLSGRSRETVDKGKVERVEGIEPSTKAWEAFVLPLNYTRVCAELFTRTLHELEARVIKKLVGTP